MLGTWQLLDFPVPLPPHPQSRPVSPRTREAGVGLNQGFPFSPQAPPLPHLTVGDDRRALGTTRHHGFPRLGLWKGQASQEAAGCHGNARFEGGSTL